MRDAINYLWRINISPLWIINFVYVYKVLKQIKNEKYSTLASRGVIHCKPNNTKWCFRSFVPPFFLFVLRRTNRYVIVLCTEITIAFNWTCRKVKCLLYHFYCRLSGVVTETLGGHYVNWLKLLKLIDELFFSCHYFQLYTCLYLKKLKTTNKVKFHDEEAIRGRPEMAEWNFNGTTCFC